MGMTLLLQTNIQCNNDEHIHIKVFLKKLKGLFEGDIRKGVRTS